MIQYRNGRGVLIIHPGAVGDVLLARPALFRIRYLFPHHEMVLLAGSSVGMLLQESAEIDRVLSLESNHLTDLFTDSSDLHSAFKKWLRSCDLAVGWLQDAEGAVSASLRSLGIQRVHIQSPTSPRLSSQHQAARYLEVVEGGESASEVRKNPLILSSDGREMGRRLLQTLHWRDCQRLVVIHPGSGSRHKCMEAAAVATVVEWLYRKGLFPLLLEGPSDAEAVDRVRQLLKVTVPVLRDAELSTVAAALSYADLYIGHDSGITHLAAALSIPTLACFGPTKPRQWAPLGSSVSILTGDTCDCHDWSTVKSCQSKVCLRIPPARVIQACRKLLRKRPEVSHP